MAGQAVPNAKIAGSAGRLSAQRIKALGPGYLYAPDINSVNTKSSASWNITEKEILMYEIRRFHGRKNPES